MAVKVYYPDGRIAYVPSVFDRWSGPVRSDAFYAQAAPPPDYDPDYTFTPHEDGWRAVRRMD